MARKKLKHFPFHDEKKLVEAAIIFFNKSNVETQKNFYYDPSTKRKRYQVDCLIEKRRTIMVLIITIISGRYTEINKDINILRI